MLDFIAFLTSKVFFLTVRTIPNDVLITSDAGVGLEPDGCFVEQQHKNDKRNVFTVLKVEQASNLLDEFGLETNQAVHKG